MPTNQAKPEVTKLRSMDIDCEINRAACSSCPRVVEVRSHYIDNAIRQFTELGWRRINNRVHCPECVADVTSKEGGEGWNS